MGLKTRSFPRSVRASCLSLSILAALAASPHASAQVDESRQGQSDSLLAWSSAVGRVSVSIEQDSVPADGQTPAVLEISVLDRQGQPLSGDTVVTLEASNGRFQLPGASSDELGLAARDLDKVMPGFQVVAHDGKANVWLLAPAEPQQVKVRVSADASVAQGVVNFVPELRDMLAVGIVEGIVSFDRKNPLSLSQARAEDGFEEQIHSWSRLSGDGKRNAALRTAFFLKGKVKGDALLTMSYDSDKPGRDVLFRDLDPERWYPVYGDASITGFDARSTSRLYLRLDKDRNYLMYGDIVTGDGFSQFRGQGDVASTQVRDLGQYNRAMTGVRGHLEGERGSLDVFAADDNLRQVVEEFPGRGLSGPYTVSNSSSAVLGSERVELIVRDRYAPSRIVSVKQLARFNDYSFEPFSGRILFTTPVPSVDEQLNPVSVRITYEVEQGGENFWVYGANGQYRASRHFEVGGSYVKDENPLAPLELGSVNATVRFGENTWLRGEVARTRSAVNSIGGNIYTLNPLLASGQEVTGDAWRAEFGHTGDRFSMLGWYGESDPEFNNPASSYLGGRRQAGLDAKWILGGNAAEGTQSQWMLYAQGNWIEDTLSDADRGQVQAGLRYSPSEKFSLEIGANNVSEHAGSGLGNGLVVPGNLAAPYGVGVVSPGFGGGFFGGSTNALNPGTGQTLYNTGTSWSTGFGNWVGNGMAGVPVEYSALRIGATWRPTPRWDISGEVEQDISHSEHRRASLGAGWEVHDKTRLFGRYEWNTGLSSVATSEGVTDPVTGQRIPSPYETNAFVFGLESEYMDGGTVFNEYRMYDAYSARQAQWASGIRNVWKLNDEWSLQTGAEKLEVLDGQGQSATAVTVAAEWRPDDLWLVNGRLEWRRTEAGNYAGQQQQPVDPDIPVASWLNEDYTSWLSTITVARKISRDWTVLLRNYYLLNSFDSDRADSYENRFQAGFAYRDTDTNRVNVLGKYEYWTRRDSTLADWRGQDDLLGLSDGYDKHIVSLNADWHPHRVWWMTGRLAGKRQTDRFDGELSRFTAYLAGGRITYDFSERWDVSGMGYQMWSPGGSKQFAAGAEVGYLLVQNLWLSAGYNVRGFRADDLTAGEYTNQGMYLRLRFKFDETLFRGKNPAINPALPR